MNFALISLSLLPMRLLTISRSPEAMLIILKTTKTVNSGLLRFKLQMK